jgi:hypothetical protein
MAEIGQDLVEVRFHFVSGAVHASASDCPIPTSLFALPRLTSVLLGLALFGVCDRGMIVDYDHHEVLANSPMLKLKKHIRSSVLCLSPTLCWCERLLLLRSGTAAPPLILQEFFNIKLDRKRTSLSVVDLDPIAIYHRLP